MFSRSVENIVKPILKPCECGCKTLVIRRFVSGHNRKGVTITQEHREKLGCDNKGAESVGWKGGRRVNGNGYIEIYAPNHPYAIRRHVLEHRLVMEKFLRRFLTIDEEVHHINGNKTDNRIENLLLLTKSQHTLLHWNEGKTHTRKR